MVERALRTAGEPIVFRDRFPGVAGRGRPVPASADAAAETANAGYPQAPITGRELGHRHLGAMSRRAATLDAIEPPTVAMLHPAAGSRLGVEPGQPAAVKPRRGPIVLAVRAAPSPGE
jgi:formate dehydrogenase major subunit